MAEPRTPEAVTEEIRREREELARAVVGLRSELREATDVRRILRTKRGRLALAATTVAVGAIVAGLVLGRKKHKQPVVLARIGRLAIIERDDD